MRSLYVNGDSLAVGTLWFLQSFLPNVKIVSQAKVGKKTATGLDEMRAHRLVEDAVYISLGTNDYPSVTGTAAFETAVMKTIRWADGKTILWSNIHRPNIDGYSYGAFNRVLNHAERTYGNFHVHRWYATAVKHPEWFGPDGIHPGNTGYERRARQVANLLLRYTA